MTLPTDEGAFKVEAPDSSASHRPVIESGSFFVTGGTLARDAPSYISRQADEDLFQALERGEFCYVLTSRQMGKSSLMVRTATRLKRSDATVAVAVLDLTAVGQNLSAAQWYRGLLGRLGRQLNLEDELTRRWRECEELGALQRWTETVFDTLLAHLPGRIVLFIDEIDAVRSLPFSADEFFGAIRESYNRRSQDPAYDRVAFCLLGVASPSELISDPRMSPFNVGTRIELTDFTAAEAAPLARALPGGAPVLTRILHWTGGHPYLTQRLCRAMEANAARTDGIDQVCERLFFRRGARETDDNLLFVQDRLLRSGAGDHGTEAAALLDLYGRVRSNRRVTEQEAGEAGQALLLAGTCRAAEDGRLRVRNRIYATAFDCAWVERNLPGAERQRQRRAYHRGLWRALSLSSGVLFAVTWLAVAAHLAEVRAQRSAAEARQQLFIADMDLAQRAYAEKNIARTVQLLEAHRARPGEAARFEWRYLWGLCHGETARLVGHTAGVAAVRFAPDGTLRTVDAEGRTARIWDRGKSKVAAWKIPQGGGGIPRVALSPDGECLAAWSNRRCRLYDARSGRLRRTLITAGGATAAAFSGGGRMLVIGDIHGRIHLWDLTAASTLPTQRKSSGPVASVALSPDGRFIACGGYDGSVFLWDRTGESLPRSLSGHRGMVRAIGFSPDGGLLATGARDATVRLWRVPTGRLLRVLQGHRGQITTLAFGADGKWLATGSADQTARLWDVGRGEAAQTIQGHTDGIEALAFSTIGEWLVTGGKDGVARVWDVGDAMPTALEGTGALLRLIRLSPDGRHVAAIDRTNRLHLWDGFSGKERCVLPPAQAAVWAMAFLPGGDRLVSVDQSGAATIRDATQGDVLKKWRGQPGLATAAAVSPDGTLLATGGNSGTGGCIWLWRLGSELPMRSLPLPAGGAASLAFSPDGRWLAAGSSKDHTIRLLEVASGRVSHVFPGHTGPIGDLAFSPEGDLLASASFDGTIRLWPIAAQSGSGVRMLRGHAGPVYTVRFSPDGRTLATGGKDGMVRLWDAGTGQEVLTLPFTGGNETVATLLFDGSGDALQAIGGTGTTARWRTLADPKDPSDVWPPAGRK